MPRESVEQRFIRYARIDTQSCPGQMQVPSTEKQFDLARLLEKEMKEMGLQNVRCDEHCYVYGTLPSNVEKEIAPIGFIAHMDTAPDFSGKDVKPQIIRYEGGNLSLSDTVIMKESDFPILKGLVGEELITTDGTTLLGADNKAGVAEIMDAMAHLIENPQISHGEIKIAFTPDEEVGRGADFFDIEGFGADFAYTVDGGPIGEVTYESFNAATAKIHILGKSIHPGTAKNQLVNAQLLGIELWNMLPAHERPEHTENYEGYYLLHHSSGNVEEFMMEITIRDFCKVGFAKRKQLIQDACDFMNRKYSDRVSLEFSDTYYNMKEKIEPVFHIVDLAKQSMIDAGVTPFTVPIRGGTDGSRLSYMGLPTPNLFSGGFNYHGRYELIPISSMHKAVDVIVKIAENHAKTA